MAKYIIKIPIETEADPSTLLDVAQQFSEFFEERTSEDAVVDEEETSVEPIS